MLWGQWEVHWPQPMQAGRAGNSQTASPDRQTHIAHAKTGKLNVLKLFVNHVLSS